MSDAITVSRGQRAVSGTTCPSDSRRPECLFEHGHDVFTHPPYDHVNLTILHLPGKETLQGTDGKEGRVVSSCCCAHLHSQSELSDEMSYHGYESIGAREISLQLNILMEFHWDQEVSVTVEEKLA